MRTAIYVGSEPLVDPAGLSIRQRTGDACAICGRRWPRPRIRVGHFPDGTPAIVCDDCAAESGR